MFLDQPKLSILNDLTSMTKPRKNYNDQNE
jgi:hypothetical protein